MQRTPGGARAHHRRPPHRQRGRSPRFVAALAPLVEATLAEEGCHLYEFNQSNDDPCVFVVYEKWADQAALDLHMQTPHLQGLVAEFGAEFTAAPVIEPFTRVA